jgi:plastocyanin
LRSSFPAALLIAVATWGCGSSSGSPAGPNPAAAATITIVGDRGAQSFAPNPSSVAQGTTFAWRNTDSVVHHIVFNDGSHDSGDIAPGASSPSLTLGVNGANFHCTIHPTMVGSIKASTGEAPPCTGPYC